jgi:hypothetical protein
MGELQGGDPGAYDDPGPVLPWEYDANGHGEGLLTGLRNGTWLDAQQFPPLAYAVPGIVPEGLTVLVGAPKIGKSWMVLGFALAVASGGMALSAVPVPAARDVLYLALEDGDRRMQSRCRATLDSPYRPADPIPVRFAYLTRITPGAMLATIGAWLEIHHGAGPLIIVDTLGKVMPPTLAGETPYARDYRVMGELKDLADYWPGTCLVICHHDRKAASADFVDSVSGTHGIAGGADTVLVLTRPRTEPAGLLQITGRDVTEAEYAVTFSGGNWALDGGSLAAAAAAATERHATANLGDRSADIVAFAGRNPAGIRAADVAAQFGMADNEARSYLSRLADVGRIKRASRGLYGGVANVASVADTPSDATEATNATPLDDEDQQ